MQVKDLCGSKITIMSLKCLIIEDEKSSQELLRSRIVELFPEVDIVGIIDNFLESVNFLNKHKVDIVFLDNHIKGGTGLDVLSRVSARDFEVIFSTAYSEYAIEALNYGAVYYLLKPFSKEEFVISVKKALAKVSQSSGFLVIGQANKIAIQLNQLMYVQSEGAYCMFVLSNKRVETSSKNLGHYESKLPADHFFRIHHSCIVNINYVGHLERGEAPFVLLTDGETRLSISQRRFKAFFERINKL